MRRIMLAAAVAALANMLLGSLDAADKGETGPEPKTIRRQAALEEINTLAQEFAPTFSPDGKTMVFSSTRSSGTARRRDRRSCARSSGRSGPRHRTRAGGLETTAGTGMTYHHTTEFTV
ncbi:MAG TPA: hypothetical protein PKW28_15640, partial [Turneriella sp.]|nr:hypothetical protein [Turneriella sp.]